MECYLELQSEHEQNCELESHLVTSVTPVPSHPQPPSPFFWLSISVVFSALLISPSQPIILSFPRGICAPEEMVK